MYLTRSDGYRRVAGLVCCMESNKNLSEKGTKNKPMSMISMVQSNDLWRQSRGYQKSVKVGRICWKGRLWVWSERVK